jgi:hypothetical protein
LDFDLLDYIDISKKILRDASRADEASTFFYLYDNPDAIPETVLKMVEVHRDLLQSKLTFLLGEFKQFRHEKRIVKSIKFKA